MRWRLVFEFCVLSTLAGCDPNRLDQGGLFEVFTMENRDSAEAAFLVPDRQTIGAGARFLKAAAGDLGAVRYRLGGQRRAYLFNGDLLAGITGGERLQLPPLDPGEIERTVDIAPFDPTLWTSLRIYDAGLCSLRVDWASGGTVLGNIPPAAKLITQAVDNLFVNTAGVMNGRRTSAATVTPDIRAAQGSLYLSHDTDAIRFSADYLADRIGGMTGCNNVGVNIAFEVGFERVNGGISNAPACLGPGMPGGYLQTNDDFTYDYNGIVYGVAVTPNTSGCLIDISGMLEAAIGSALPEAVRSAVLDATLVDPRKFGITDIRPCTCDVECNSFDGNPLAYGYEGGRRPRCHFDGTPAPGAGECWIQVEVDRVNVRPDGLEMVLMEDESDRQFALLSGTALDGGLCDPGRDTTIAAERSTLPYPITIPASP